MSPPRVLVVDDNVSLRENLVECLLIEGYPVDVAADGNAALAALMADPRPDVLVADLMMPGLDGRELVRRIRADPRLASVRIVLTTGHPSPAVRQGIAVDAFLAKPFGVNELLAAIRKAMA
jgi:CheY-like chemotaxis protein